MRKTFALGLTAALSVATLGFAAPARAADWPTDCLRSSGAIDFESFSIDLVTLEVRINPAGVGPDVDMVTSAVTGLALCLENDIVLGRVTCLLGKVEEIVTSINVPALYLRYVYQDPATGELVIDGGRLVEDATACLP